MNMTYEGLGEMFADSCVEIFPLRLLDEGPIGVSRNSKTKTVFTIVSMIIFFELQKAAS